MATKNAPRVMITIDGQETLLTNAIMMDYAVKALEETDAPVEVIEKAKLHLAALTKKNTDEKVPTKTAIENNRLAHELAKIMPTDEPVTVGWIMNHVNGIITVQKAAKIAGILCDKGVAVRVPKADGRAMGYQLVNNQ